MNLDVVFADLWQTPAFNLAFAPSAPALSSTPIFLDSQREFACAFPNTSLKNTTQETSAATITTTTATALEILDKTNRKCLFLNRGWWTYQFCYNSHFSQIHVPSDKEKTSLAAMNAEQRKLKEQEYRYVIGKYSDLPTSKEIAPSSTEIVHANPSFISQRWGGGSFCQLTNSPRQVKVLYYCMPNVDDHIASVKEISSCNYLVVINTHRLCDDVAFIPKHKNGQSHEITCSQTSGSHLVKTDENLTVQQLYALLNPFSESSIATPPSSQPLKYRQQVSPVHHFDPSAPNIEIQLVGLKDEPVDLLDMTQRIKDALTQMDPIELHEKIREAIEQMGLDGFEIAGDIRDALDVASRSKNDAHHASDDAVNDKGLPSPGDVMKDDGPLGSDDDAMDDEAPLSTKDDAAFNLINPSRVRSQIEKPSLEFPREIPTIMEVANQIQKIENVTLAKGKESYAGVLYLYTHHIFFQGEIQIIIPNSTLKTVDKKFRTPDGENPIYIQTRTFIFIRVFIKSEAQCDLLYQNLTRLMNVESVEQLYAFHYEPLKPYTPIYDAVEEFTRQGLTSLWRISKINADYSFSPSYPHILVVPEKISDVVLKHIGPFRSKSRIPVLSYIHRNGASITRSSQPMVGLKQNRSIQDEKLVEAIFSTTSEKGLIIDARPAANAMGQMALGAGTENTDLYRFGRLHFAGIDNIHVIRDSQNKLMEALQSNENPILRSQLDKSGWLKHIKNILEGTLLVTQNITNKINVLVHCSDGWDRTAQLCSLAEICLDPYYRTIEGFMILIEKEWCSFGFKFSDRCGHLSKPSGDASGENSAGGSVMSQIEQSSKSVGKMLSFGMKSFMKQGREALGSEPATHKTSESTKVNLLAPKEVSPVFTQFLDCVYQLWTQFPTFFEYNEAFLILINTHLYASQFGTFFFNCERERTRFKCCGKPLNNCTSSLWDYILETKEDCVDTAGPIEESAMGKVVREGTSAIKDLFSATPDIELGELILEDMNGYSQQPDEQIAASHLADEGSKQDIPHYTDFRISDSNEDLEGASSMP